MNKIAVAMLLVLSLMFFLTGCEEEDFLVLGDEAPEYSRLLDVESWMDYFMAGVESEIRTEEDEMIFDTLASSLGFKRIHQEKAEAYIKEGNTVFATNTMAYDRVENDDSLLATMLEWEPGNHDFSEGFDPAEMYGMAAIGNPESLVDSIFKWLTESESFENLLGVIAGETGDPEARFMMKTAIMTAKGYWFTIQEEVYPIVGDELVIALIKNPDFLGFDEYGDTYDEAVPFKTMIAVETEKEGLDEDIDYLIENYMQTLLGGIFGYGMNDDEEFQEMFKIHEKKIGGYEIHYLNFEDEFMLGWTQYDDGLFISDLDTLERIDEFYNSSRQVPGAPDMFNTYLAINADAIFKDFIEPNDEEISDEIDWMIKDEETGAVEVREMYNLAKSGEDMGIIQLGSRIFGDRVERILTLNKHTADILLHGITFVDEMVAEEMAMLEEMNSGEIMPGVMELEEE